MSISVPRVSVIIPAYNAERYLGECLQSMTDQIEKSLEILVINDGSTDNTLEIAHQWAQIDERIKVLNKENGGAGSARNLGFEQAIGKYIAVQDADDYSHPLRFQHQADFLDRNDGVDYVGSYAKRIGCNERSLGFITPPSNLAAIQKRMRAQIAFVHASLMFRRKIIDDGIRYDTTLISAQDWEMLTRVASKYSGANVPAPLYVYRNVGTQLTQKYAIGGAIRGRWVNEQLFRQKNRLPLLSDLPSSPSRNDAVEMGLDADKLDQNVLTRFEYVMRLNLRSLEFTANQHLALELRTYRDMMLPKYHAKADALLFLYGGVRNLTSLSNHQLRHELINLAKREAMYHAHILKRGWEFRKWNYTPQV